MQTNLARPRIPCRSSHTSRRWRCRAFFEEIFPGALTRTRYLRTSRQGGLAEVAYRLRGSAVAPTGLGRDSRRLMRRCHSTSRGGRVCARRADKQRPRGRRRRPYYRRFLRSYRLSTLAEQDREEIWSCIADEADSRSQPSLRVSTEVPRGDGTAGTGLEVPLETGGGRFVGKLHRDITRHGRCRRV